jgi:DNA (cytosine-5)-methyltransferase 1
MAVQEVFGGEVVWHSEIDKAASKVLAYRLPEVPNLGSITEIDWATVEPVDVLCGGFPCTDVSAAGKRAGMHGTRSGLWTEFAKAIDILRPRMVVIENVRGLLSAHANRPMESDDVSVGDGGTVPVLRAAGAVLGDLSDIGYDAAWTTLAAGDVGAPHRRERVFILATSESSRIGWEEGRTESARLVGGFDAAVGGDGLAAQSSGAAVGFDTGGASGAEAGAHPGDRSGDHRGERADVELLPTPVVTDSADSARHTIVGGTSHPGTSLTDAIRLLPTPRSSDCFGAGLHGEGGMDLRTTIDLLCTPTAGLASSGQTSRSGKRINEPLLNGQAREMASSWGKYEPAIRRWENIVGPAPAPTEPGRNGNPRLSAAFSEWLMGWPAGWVTDPAIGISRNDQLRIVGNGVCPQQAAAAMRQLLAVAC